MRGILHNNLKLICFVFLFAVTSTNLLNLHTLYVTVNQLLALLLLNLPLILSSRITPAHAARREQEPVHENTLTIVIGIVSQQSMPLIFLLAAAIPCTTCRARNLASLLVYGLLEVFRIDHGQSFAAGIERPVRGYDLGFALANVHSEIRHITSQ